jgi:type II secretory pathway predicted ATPase ExeA
LSTLPAPLERHSEVVTVDIEDRLKKLQSLFTYALSGAVAAKARYLAIVGDLGSTPAAVARAKMTWHHLEARKTAIIARMVELEELAEEAAAV